MGGRRPVAAALGMSGEKGSCGEGRPCPGKRTAAFPTADESVCALVREGSFAGRNACAKAFAPRVGVERHPPGARGYPCARLQSLEGGLDEGRKRHYMTLPPLSLLISLSIICFSSAGSPMMSTLRKPRTMVEVASSSSSPRAMRYSISSCAIFPTAASCESSTPSAVASSSGMAWMRPSPRISPLHSRWPRAGAA